MDLLCASKDKPAISIREDPKEGIKVTRMNAHIVEFLWSLLDRRVNFTKLQPCLTIYLDDTFLNQYMFKYNIVCQLLFLLKISWFPDRGFNWEAGVFCPWDAGLCGGWKFSSHCGLHSDERRFITLTCYLHHHTGATQRERQVSLLVFY